MNPGIKKSNENILKTKEILPMIREYFCPHCGLFFWHELYTEVDGIPHRNHVTCLNAECELHKSPELGMIFAVDSMGFFYYAEEHKERINQIKWSSSKFSPPAAIEVYKKQGMTIKEQKGDE